jgi:SPX domain protein involved in polyphosphate accumulation
MFATPTQSVRYERKYFLNGLERAHVRALVLRHPAMFHQPYPPRYVNNIYMDTPWMDNYGDNVSGSTARRKVRVRWYHDLMRQVNSPLLEFKVKRGGVGWKDIYSLPPFTFDRGLTARRFQQLVNESTLPPQVKETLTGLNLVLVNRYRREYYETRDRRFRVTVDSDLVFYRTAVLSNSLSVREVDHGVVVVELKYDSENERDADRVSSKFPFRVTRSSKYIQGLERFVVT